MANAAEVEGEMPTEAISTLLQERWKRRVRSIDDGFEVLGL
jgi:hypothetical protein